jgi:hypothetical protein
MKVREVIALAGRWVEETGSRFPGFRGAYLAGSINEMAREETFPFFKDVDIYVVVEDPARIAVPQQKFLYEGVLLEPLCMSLQEHLSPDAVLAAAHAGSVACCEILSDPTGFLESLRASVASDYARTQWIAARCERQKLLLSQLLAQADSPPDTVFLLAFAVLFLGGLVALASLKTPTVRRSLALAGELLQKQGRSDLQENLLELLGCARMKREQVIGHLEDCVHAFDRSVEVISTPFYGSWNLHTGTRPYLVDGSYEMIGAGRHREAMLWITMIHSVSHTAIQNDAPEADRTHDHEGMQRLRTALGISTATDWRSRTELARTVSARVIRFADDMVARSA